MFELFLVTITLFSPVLFIVFIRSYFGSKRNRTDDYLQLVSEVKSKQIQTEVTLKQLTERLTKLETKIP